MDRESNFYMQKARIKKSPDFAVPIFLYLKNALLKVQIENWYFLIPFQNYYCLMFLLIHPNMDRAHF